MKKALLLFALLCATPLFAERVPVPQTYGTGSEIVLVIPQQALVTTDSFQTWAASSWMKWITNNAGCCLEAPVTLPEGATVIGVAIEGCDTSTTEELTANLVSCTTPAGVCAYISPGAESGFTETGCGIFRANLSTPVTINNATTTYAVHVESADSTGHARTRAARVYYKLQVSPAPATATFSDVPTSHPFFQFIEALAASGITAGCSAPPNPNYCPDAPLTRGQMAVFLSRALGLHWAP